MITSRIMVSNVDQCYMTQAIELARQVLYLTDPNPRVGCVITRHGRVIGQGSTQAAGGPHAEVMALRSVQEQGHGHLLKGSTIYVTLEPCSHYGRTPPCVNAIIAAQPARVVVAMLDPNPLVGGKGIEMLRSAGIQVQLNVLTEQALELNPGFISRMACGRPWLWTKIATSLDAKVALANGQSQWITGAEARADGHHWRARSSLVLTGIGTVLADNPLLNVRAVDTPRQPIRAVLDSQFRIDPESVIFNGDPVWILVNEAVAELPENQLKATRLVAQNVTLIPIMGRAGQIDLNALMGVLAERHINEVHLEAGSGLNSAFLAAGLIDELLIYMAPKIIGLGQTAFHLPELNDLRQSHAFSFIEQCLLGSDLRLRLRYPQRWQILLQQVQALV